MKTHFGLRIKKMVKEKKIKQSDLCTKLGMTRAGINAIYSRKDINTELLQKISIVLKVPMSYWFQEDQDKKFDSFYYLGNDECGIRLSEAEKKISYLEDQLKTKDKLISVLENSVNMMNKK